MSSETVYCVKCGQANYYTNVACTNCGTRLQKSIPSHVSVTPKSGSWWDRLNPALKGAVVMFIGIFILRSTASLTKGLSCLLSFPVEIILALIQGVLVSKYAAQQRPKYKTKDFPTQAALSAFYVYLPSLLVGVLLGLATGDLLLVPLLVANFIQGLGGILLYILMTWISSWIYVRTGGTGMLGILIGVGCTSIIVVAIAIAVIVYLLATLGYELINYYTLAITHFI